MFIFFKEREQNVMEKKNDVITVQRQSYQGM